MKDEDEEIEFHLAMLTRDLVSGGRGEKEARQEALRRFGDPASVRAAAAVRRRNRRWVLLVLAALTLSLVMQQLLRLTPWYRHLYKLFPFYVPESLKNLLEIGVCLAALLAARTTSIRRALGVDGRVFKGMAFGIVSTLPMLLGFAVAYRVRIGDVRPLIYLAFFSPLIEELVGRGFGFRALRRAGWPLWPAAAACALLTGLAHIEKGQSAASILGLFFLTGLGGGTFCWLIERWQSIWFPFALHAMMNFWWEIFRVGPTALGGWYAAALQNGSVLLAILITHRLTPRPDSGGRTSRRARPSTAGLDGAVHRVVALPR